MEHSAQYNRIMNSRKKKEIQRRAKVERIMKIMGVGFAALCGVILLLGILIRIDHHVAVRRYNENNWVTVENTRDGKHIYGKTEGEDFEYTDNGTYFGGIFIDGVELKGMTYEQARSAVMDAIEKKLNSINMVVIVHEASLTLTASDFNISVDASETLEKAYRLGRENLNDYAANYKRQQQLLEKPVEFHLNYTCDPARITSRVAEIADFVNTEPVEPYITVSQRPSANQETEISNDEPVVRDTDTIVEKVNADNGKTIGYIYYNPGKKGYVLNREAMVDRILDAFDRGDYSCVMEADLEETQPEKTPSDIKGSIVKISTYTSDFDHGSKDMNRCRNIQKAAGILNGLVVKPYREISFNTHIGPRTEAGGWLRAHGIVNGREYEDSPGGGICQVSGTLYNALLQCGPQKIKITQRQHHSWPSTYVPIGLDATVDTNGPDLKWRNISNNRIDIFAYADVSKGKMYVYIYGVPEEDGSYYKTYAEVDEEIEPPEPVIVKSNTLPAGYQKTTIKSRPGYYATAYLKHFDKNGELIETIKLYRDYYAPVRGEITVGTGAAFG